MQDSSYPFYGFSGGEVKIVDSSFFDFLGNNWNLYNAGGHLFYEPRGDSKKSGVIAPGKVEKICEIGIFTAVYVKSGIPVFLEEHVRSLLSGASASSIEIKDSDPGRMIARYAMGVAQKNAGREHEMLVELFNRSVTNGNSSLRDICCMLPYESGDIASLLSGVNVVSYRNFRHRPYRNSADASFLLEAQKYASGREAYDSIIVDHKRVCRRAINSTFFCFYENTLCTPGDKIPGDIMREKVIKITREMGIRFADGNITYDSLLKADEVFLASSLKGVVPVNSVDGKAIGNRNPGRLTMEIAGGIIELMDEYVKLYKRLS